MIETGRRAVHDVPLAATSPGPWPSPRTCSASPTLGTPSMPPWWPSPTRSSAWPNSPGAEGRAVEAVNELWPLVARLQARAVGYPPANLYNSLADPTVISNLPGSAKQHAALGLSSPLRAARPRRLFTRSAGSVYMPPATSRPPPRSRAATRSRCARYSTARQGRYLNTPDPPDMGGSLASCPSQAGVDPERGDLCLARRVRASAMWLAAVRPGHPGVGNPAHRSRVASCPPARRTARSGSRRAFARRSGLSPIASVSVAAAPVGSLVATCAQARL
jgi:hypothetical protein